MKTIRSFEARKFQYFAYFDFKTITKIIKNMLRIPTKLLSVTVLPAVCGNDRSITAVHHYL